MKNRVSASSPRFLGLKPNIMAIALIAIATVGRLMYCAWLPILPDETYYLQWSRHLDASYYSKGPAIAYTIAAGVKIFGPTNFGVRFFAVLLSAGTAWQIYLLARRWFDSTTGLFAVLLAGVVPLYALGSVVMTIDPLSAFFWMWAACLFSRAVKKGGVIYWLLTGFAVGSGFLAKYINAVELLAFLAFLLVVPARRHLLAQRGFWLMLLVALVCTTPVIWWNRHHDWVSLDQLLHRGNLESSGPFKISFKTFLQFLGLQALVISPAIFAALILTVFTSVRKKFRRRDGRLNEGEVFLFILFLPVFLMYAALSWHMRCEPNWPAISYLSLIIILASHWRKYLLPRRRGGFPYLLPFGVGRRFMIAVFSLAWLQTLLMHETQYLPLPQKQDPVGRVIGWKEIADRLQDLGIEQKADFVVADGYKEASVFSFYMVGHPFVYTVRHQPPSNQFDLWPGYAVSRGGSAIWITSGSSTQPLQHDFNSITLLEHVMIQFHGKPLREYDIYLCENR